jgi:hypothetical protein
LSRQMPSLLRPPSSSSRPSGTLVRLAHMRSEGPPPLVLLLPAPTSPAPDPEPPPAAAGG